MKVLITGGNGYIAKSIYNALYKFYDITSITRKDCDLEDTQAVNDWFKDKTFDVVIHTAIQGGSRLKSEDQSVIDSNLNMFNNLLINKDQFKKFISFGSGAEIYAPETPYGKSKSIINDIIKKEPNFYNIRIFAVFDENELNTRFIKHNILQYIKKKPIEIYNNKIMDFFYTKDLLSVIDYCMNNDILDKEINCCYTEKYTLKDIADMINSLNDHKVPIIIQSNNELKIYAGQSNLKIKTIGLKEGLKNTYDILNRQFN